jgi:hypothetical protein
VLAALLAVLASWSCSGGGGGGSAGTTNFQLMETTLSDGSSWPINQEMVFRFTEPVDFTTVSSNTIQIRSTSDVPATGVFRQRDEHTLVFQPTCPTRDDFSDSGLSAGQTYQLRIPGLNTSSNVLRSTTGVGLGIQQQRTFSTPASTQASVVFRDVRPGPPEPIVRAKDTGVTNATRVELGEDASQVIWFERAPNGDLVLSEADFPMPLNLYSDASSRVAVVVVFDQPVNPSSTNISTSRLRLEFEDNTGTWRPIATRVTLVENCTEAGATVRLEPIGVLPQASRFRATVRAGFQDIVGEAVLVAETDFARARTRAVEFTSLTSDLLSDEFQEPFDFGGDSPLSFQDEDEVFDTPPAEWGDGKLTAAFSFEGTGGPNGDFDWVVRAGDVVNFDTTSQPIVGGPNGLPTAIQNTANGILDVRHLIIEAGAQVRVQGPNPMRINATGDVRILGTLDISGFPAKDVATLDTGNQTEVGGAGVGGAGTGGKASENVTGPTPRGGTGQGPFRQANLGGQGGEMGVSNAPPTSNEGNTRDKRRPGGGGGGRFSTDWIGVLTVGNLSTAAGPGTDGHPEAVGAVTGVVPARGGQPGDGPFIDVDPNNDFFGVRPEVENGNLVRLVRGELPRLWAGYGGGGGGNAGPFFPNPNWNFATDEKGGGGGGGGGGLHIKALGRIVFGPLGKIQANGARGATGENTYFLDHVGGTGGGGSGGHVILESATQVDFTNGGSNVGAAPADFVAACGPVTTKGRQDWMAPCCMNVSNGGPGGAGVVQIHVPNPTLEPSSSQTSEIVVPTSALQVPGILDGVTSPPAYVMIPSFGKQSKARSDWISIGGADQDPSPGAPPGLVRFLFDGIETSGEDAGKIRRNGAFAADLTPLVETQDLDTSSSVRLLSDGFSVELKGSALDAIRAGSTGGISNDIYLRTPALLEDCAVRLFVASAESNREDFSIVAAQYDEGAESPGDEVLLVRTTTERGRLDAFNDPPAGPTGLRLMPRFFQVSTGGQENQLLPSAFVRLRFQAARDDGFGAPDEANPLTDPPWTSDISLFNQLPAGELQFFRFEVEFDLDAMDEGITQGTEPVSLEFLKIPFVF